MEKELTEIQKNIRLTLKQYSSISLVKKHLSELELKLSEAYAKMKIHENTLDKELKDVEALENGGVKALFHKVLGSIEDQLNRERQEYLEASLRYKEFIKRVELMEFERNLLVEKAGDLTIVAQSLNNLKEKRKLEILSSHGAEDKVELEEIMSKHDETLLVDKELKEAIVEGDNCLKLLNVVISYLKKARDWGQWNSRTSRGRTTFGKQGAVDHAIQTLSKAQVRLDMFSKELADLGNNHIKFDLSNAQFGEFTNFFFDNLISDWIIQQKIKGTISNVEMVVSKIQRISLGLTDELKKNKLLQQQLQKRQELILTR